MSNRISYLKATVVGGLVFLVPVAVILLVVGKVVVGLKEISYWLLPMLPFETATGLVALNLLALLLVALLCFLAGLAAQSATGKRWRETLEDVLLSAIPGYLFVKGFSESLHQSDELAQGFQPVAVRFDDYIQIAFEIERDEDSMVAIYLPGAPNPWSGSVVYVTADRVKPLKMTVSAAVKNIRKLGKGSLDYVKLHGRLFDMTEDIAEPQAPAAPDTAIPQP